MRTVGVLGDVGKRLLHELGVYLTVTLAQYRVENGKHSGTDFGLQLAHLFINNVFSKPAQVTVGAIQHLLRQSVPLSLIPHKLLPTMGACHNDCALKRLVKHVKSHFVLF